MMLLQLLAMTVLTMMNTMRQCMIGSSKGPTRSRLVFWGLAPGFSTGVHPRQRYCHCHGWAVVVRMMVVVIMVVVVAMLLQIR